MGRQVQLYSHKTPGKYCMVGPRARAQAKPTDRSWTCIRLLLDNHLMSGQTWPDLGGERRFSCRKNLAADTPHSLCENEGRMDPNNAVRSGPTFQPHCFQLSLLLLLGLFCAVLGASGMEAMESERIITRAYLSSPPGRDHGIGHAHERQARAADPVPDPHRPRRRNRNRHGGIT